MKKQLLIAAVAATMTSVAMADISITGAAAVNYTTTDFDAVATPDTNAISHDFDLKVTGKSGATSVVMDIENTDAAGGANELNVKNAYMKTSVAGVDVKMGTWFGSDSLLGNGTQTADRVVLSTTVSGFGIAYEDDMTDSAVSVSGELGGVSISHEIAATSTDTEISGSFGGVDIAFRSVNDDTDAADKTSLEVSTEVSGATLTYATVDANETSSTGTTSDAFFGTFATGSEITEASGFGAKMALAGNTVNVKSYTTTLAGGTVEQDWTKVVVTRALASGATIEATYTDKDAVSEKLDLELNVKF